MTVNQNRVEYSPFPKLTGDFVVRMMKVGWKDLAWAAHNHWLDVGSLVALADRIAETDEDLRVSIACASLNEDGALGEILERQAASDDTPDAAVRARWMRVAVAWVYQNRAILGDPLAVIEEIWEAFDHPKELNGLIRWMPVSTEGGAGEEEMIKHLIAYVDRVKNH